MTVPAPAAHTSFGGIVAVWVAAAVTAVTIGIVAPDDWRAAWMAVGLAGCIVLAFVVQLVQGHPDGFLQRVAASSVGALVVMGLIGLGLGMSTLFST
ncbi:MAG: hypothetical protein QM622_11730 [Microbacterium sp.]